MHDRLRARGDAFLAFFLYSLLTVIMTWPLAGRLGTHIPASAGDSWVHLWTFNWIKDALTAGHTPYYTHLLFYPHGVSLLYHNIAWVNIVLWLPLQAIFGGGAAYSLVFMFIFAFNGFATYLLAREVTGSRRAAFFAGSVVAFWPYTTSHHTHPNLIFIAWIPLALLYLHHTLERGHLRDALLAGVFVALIGLTRWQLLVMGGFLIGFYLLYRFVADGSVRNMRSVRLMLLVGVVAVLIMSPLLLPVAGAQLTRENPEELFVDEEVGQTDLLAYLLPSRYHPLWGEAAFNLYDNFGVNKVLVPFLGYTVLLLALFGLYSQWPETRLWFLAVLLYLFLALGPELLLNGQRLIPLPYALVDDLFLIKIIRQPDRLNVILSIPIAMLVAYGICSLRRPYLSGQYGQLATGALLGLILVEYVVAYPTFPLETPGWFYQLAEEPGEFGLLTIPMHPRALPDKANMYYQFVHGKPLVEGHVSRPPSEAFSFIESVPFLSELGVDGGVPPRHLPNVGTQLRLLREANVRYVILNKPFLTTEQLAGWREWFPLRPYHEDDDLLVYRTEIKVDRDYAIRQALLVEGSAVRLGLIQATVSPPETEQEGWVEIEVIWASVTGLERAYEACFSLEHAGEDPAQRECQTLSPAWATTRWRKDAIVTASYRMQVDPFVDGGKYDVVLSVQETDGEMVGNPAVLASVDVNTIPRVFRAPQPAGERTFTWDDEIRLHHYSLEQTDDTLELSLSWQALRRMDASYKVFVHLTEPATGAIVAQADLVPRNWTYPTHWWEEGEYVEDTIRLDLAAVSPGSYELSLGLYHQDTGERLDVQDRSGKDYADNSAPLGRIEIGD